MTKNVKGGNSHKKQARKNNGPPIGIKKLRVSQNECEAYAIVTKLLGNSMCYVADTTNNELLCIIRGKFRGKEKLELGTWVLVGLRSWETEKKESKPKCDLLEIYNKEETERLNKIIKHSWKMNDLNSDDLGGTSFEYDDNIDQLITPTDYGSSSSRQSNNNNEQLPLHSNIKSDIKSDNIIKLVDEEIDFDFI
jgi:initiation factor 1A